MLKHVKWVLVLLLYFQCSACDRGETAGEKPSDTSNPTSAPATPGPPERLIVQTPDGPRELPLAVRVRQLLVTPSTGPVTDALVRNLTDKVFEGTARATWPAGWSVSPASHKLRIEPHTTQRLAWTINKATDAPDNRYDVVIEVTDASGSPVVTHKQTIQCASAPYGKPTIDGRFDDWKGAIPLTFVTKGKKTVLETCWSKRRFAMRIGVEEDTFTPSPVSWVDPPPFDAVQVVLAPAGEATPREAGAATGRHEFLLYGSGADTGPLGGACWRLLAPDDLLATGQRFRRPPGHAVAGAEIVVQPRSGWTWYEVAIPMKALAPLRADPGREFAMSVLVHDPDGTGVRDWGGSAGLWPWQRNRLAWSTWLGAQWPDDPPFESRIEFGFCSSTE